MIAFLFSPIGKRLAFVAAAIVIALLVVHTIQEDARRKAIEVIERVNRENEMRADKAERGVLTCPPELWSREHQRCATNSVR